MWFEKLTGFKETSPAEVRRQLKLSGDTLTSAVNGSSFVCGTLDVISLAELRKQSAAIAKGSPLRVTEQVANVQDLHADATNTGALFQVASQFNLLEMVSPNVTPEQGVGIYENDFTQGPACAIAAGAGTIYRNYFAPTHGKIGQSATHQIDCLSELGEALQNTDGRLWKMSNGYALASAEGLDEISKRLQTASEDELEELRGKLKVGFQWGIQVTLKDCSHLVSQVYCSAMPVAYSPHSSEAWQGFAVLILEAAYEATLCAAVLNAQKTGNNTLYLTLLGGGAFGNKESWIMDAIDRAIKIHAHSGLDVRIVSYGSSNPALAKLCNG